MSIPRGLQSSQGLQVQWNRINIYIRPGKSWNVLAKKQWKGKQIFNPIAWQLEHVSREWEIWLLGPFQSGGFNLARPLCSLTKCTKHQVGNAQMAHPLKMAISGAKGSWTSQKEGTSQICALSWNGRFHWGKNYPIAIYPVNSKLNARWRKTTGGIIRNCKPHLSRETSILLFPLTPSLPSDSS